MAGLFGRMMGKGFEKMVPGLQKMVSEMEKIVGEGTSTGGFVKAKTKKLPDFTSQVVEIKIEPSAMQGTKERLEGLVTEAVNNALKKEAESVKATMTKMGAGGE